MKLTRRRWSVSEAWKTGCHLCVLLSPCSSLRARAPRSLSPAFGGPKDWEASGVRCVKAAWVVTVALTGATFALCLLSRHAVALVRPDAELPFGWRLVIYLWHSYVRLAPFGIVAVVLGSSVVPILVVPADVEEERDRLGAWLVTGFALSAGHAGVGGLWLALHGSTQVAAPETLGWILSLL